MRLACLVTVQMRCNDQAFELDVHPATPSDRSRRQKSWKFRVEHLVQVFDLLLQDAARWLLEERVIELGDCRGNSGLP